MTPRTPPQDPLATANQQLRRQTRIMARAGMTPEAYPITERRPTQGKENIAPAAGEWVFDPSSWDWTIQRTGISLSPGGSAGLTISTATSYGSLPSWGSRFDSVFLYPARPGLYMLYSHATVSGGDCEAYHFTGFSEHELLMRTGVTYEHTTTQALAADGTTGGNYDFVPMPQVINRSANTRTFALFVAVEAIVLY